MRTAEITCILTTLRTIDDINNRRYEKADANLDTVQGEEPLGNSRVNWTSHRGDTNSLCRRKGNLYAHVLRLLVLH